MIAGGKVNNIAPSPSVQSNLLPPNPDDYETKYAEDETGREADENARVWCVYLDEADQNDAERINRWREGIDILLVFAGLCSAIIAAFVIESSKKLDVNYDVIHISLLEEIIALQRASAKGVDSDAVPTSPFHAGSTPTYTRLDVWVNGIWIASLVCSISAALVATVVRHWMQYYLLPVYGTPPERVRVRQSRRNNFKQWSVSAIVRFIPVLLHVAVLLFFWGLFLFTLPLNFSIAIFIASAGGTICTLYFGSALLPLFYSDCPYRTPLAGWIHGIARVLREPSKGAYIVQKSYPMRFGSVPEAHPSKNVEIRAPVPHSKDTACSEMGPRSGVLPAYLPIPHGTSAVTSTPYQLQVEHLSVHVEALVWMASSPNESVQAAAVQAIGGLVVQDINLNMRPVRGVLEIAAMAMCQQRKLARATSEHQLDRIFRACLRLSEWRTHFLFLHVTELSFEEERSCVQLTRSLADSTLNVLRAESEAIRRVQQRLAILRATGNNLAALEEEWTSRTRFFNEHLAKFRNSQIWHNRSAYPLRSDTILVAIRLVPACDFSFLRFFFSHVEPGSEQYGEFMYSLPTCTKERRKHVKAFADSLEAENRGSELAYALAVALSS